MAEWFCVRPSFPSSPSPLPLLTSPLSLLLSPSPLGGPDTQAKIEGSVCKRFLLSPPPPPTFIFWLLFHFSRGQNRGSRSSVFLCSETKRKRLLRRLRTIMYPDKIERRNEGRLARVHRPFGQTDYFVANERFSPVWANT